MITIHKSLQGILWSVPVDDLDLDKHDSYIIHQVLMYGDFDHIKWLFDVYPKDRVIDVFLNKPEKVYTKPALNYVNKFILGLDHQALQEDKYVSTTH